MRQAGWDVQEIPGLHGGRVFAMFAPFHKRLAFENIHDGFLRAVMMDSGSRTWLDQERAAPHGGADTQLAADGGVPLRARCLGRAGIELVWMDDLDV